MRLRVGVFILIALVAFLGMIYALGARARLFEAQHTIHAHFTEVGGLTEGATVRLAGVQIGRVSAVRLPGEPGGRVRVDMTIAKRFADRIRRDSIARIETQGLLGDRIVEISVGTAAQPAVGPDEAIGSRDPTDIAHVLSEGAATVKNVAALAENLQQTAEALQQSTIIEDTAAAMKAARQAVERVAGDLTATTATVRQAAEQAGREVETTAEAARQMAERIGREVETTGAAARQLAQQIGRELETTTQTARRMAEQVGQEVTSTAATARAVTERVGRVVDRIEQGPGLAHALLYEEPRALRRVDELVAALTRVVDRVERGEGAVGVLAAAESTAAARRFVGAMERVAALTERLDREEGLLPALLFDPAHRAVLDDLGVVARNFRDVSDRLAGGRGTLGSLIRDEPGDELRRATRDIQAALANLRAITERIQDGEGTLGALLADPTVYERLVAILDGVQRSFLLRSLLRGLGRDRSGSAEPAGEGTRP